MRRIAGAVALALCALASVGYLWRPWSLPAVVRSKVKITKPQVTLTDTQSAHSSLTGKTTTVPLGYELDTITFPAARKSPPPLRVYFSWLDPYGGGVLPSASDYISPGLWYQVRASTCSKAQLNAGDLYLNEASTICVAQVPAADVTVAYNLAETANVSTYPAVVDEAYDYVTQTVDLSALPGKVKELYLVAEVDSSPGTNAGKTAQAVLTGDTYLVQASLRP